jgi:hypothetical protein
VILNDLALDVREPTGEDELFVLETPLSPVRTMVELGNRVASVSNRGPLDWARLPAASLGAVALGIRRAWVGERVVSEGTCTGVGCGERFDVSLTVSAYLAHHRPRRPRAVSPAPEAGWYSLERTMTRFRVPTVADLLVAMDDARPGLAITSACVDPPDVTAGIARRIDRALGALSPSLDGLVGGACPSCGTAVTLSFDPVSYTLAELRGMFAGIYQETHALASAYGWDEGIILRLPRGRRRRYWRMVIEGRSVA